MYKIERKLNTILTERLILRPFNLADAGFILELVNTPGWLKYIGDRKVYNVEDAANYLKNGTLKNYEIHGFGFLVMTLKDSGTAVGMCGLVKRDTLEDVDIGYALLPEFEGKGYAFEAASATLIFAKNELNLGRIVAITSMENERSGNLLTKLGFKLENKVRLSDDGEELFLYANS